MTNINSSKRIGLLFITALLVSGCQSISDEELEVLTTQANKAQALQAEKTKLLQQNKQLQQQNSGLETTVSQLNQQLEQEIIAQQVQIEKSKQGGIKVTMQEAILFPSGAFKLGKSGRAVLKKIASGLQGLDDKHQLRIVGHSDNVPVSKKLRGQFVDNWDLSARRAAEVARYMIWGYGFAPEKISVVGRSHVQPVASNKSKQGRAANRRIELFIE
ncbi:MAG: OmpA family protein [Mariprofundaceae bacterium]|nr:OmpA family protein [Mariprofundaceae bacterium]